MKKVIIIISYLALAASWSCEIEDDFPNQQVSERLGRKSFATDGPYAIHWSNSNEIITLGPNGVTTINADLKEVRMVNFGTSGIPTMAYTETGSNLTRQFAKSTWLYEHMLYFIESRGSIGSLSRFLLATKSIRI
jgi:hypothetical protein